MAALFVALVRAGFSSASLLGKKYFHNCDSLGNFIIDTWTLFLLCYVKMDIWLLVIYMSSRSNNLLQGLIYIVFWVFIVLLVLSWLPMGYQVGDFCVILGHVGS